jgi:putative ATP-dependent endonuclease of OLD family
LKDAFHHAINYGKKIKNSDKYTLTEQKIIEADQKTISEDTAWEACGEVERAYRMYNLMLNEEGKSGLKAIVAQCLASMLRLEITAGTVEKEKMFDFDLYQQTIDKNKKAELKDKFENDPYLGYLVEAIKHAVGADNIAAEAHQEEMTDVAD